MSIGASLSSILAAYAHSTDSAHIILSLTLIRLGLTELRIVHQTEFVLNIIALNVQDITVALNIIVVQLKIRALVPVSIFTWRNDKRQQ